ncbi:MAG TPA: heavy metal-binding domain-containing protein, partial [Ignavibacteriaceae bacterium]|nr:heavy metal-binding domain-containing protein [Ignavibacteriaceae bacterium]
NKDMKEMNEDSHHTMDMDNSKSGHQNMDLENHQQGEQSIVREGEIDLTAIDLNKDGKVYQDVMDWNVISDEAGECPLCGMKLKEVTVEKAKENLIKHNFKVKE